MKVGVGILILLSVGLVSSTPKFMSRFSKSAQPLRSPDFCNPIVIAHRGASGYVPEHTLGSYAMAITMGADYVEPDLVMTKDGHLIARHDNELGQTTDVAEHPEFQSRFKNLTLDGNEISGWFTEDFTLAEIKTLKAVERIPDIRPGNARMNYAFQVPTFQEILDLVKSMQSNQSNPIVIAHRGASGYVPEHTLGSYAMAITMGADYVEPDLVMTKDGHLIARHDNELGQTTDVSEHPEFQSRFKNLTLDGNEISGWFTEDFTLAEIKTLKAVERIPDIRPGNARMNYAFQVPTFQEILDLVKSMQSNQRRIIGVYPEIKHSTHFKRLGLPMELLVVDTFHKNDYHGANAPVYIQSFEVNNLKELKNLTNLRLLQLFESDRTLQPADQMFLGTNLTYGDMSTPEGLAEVAKYAAAVGPDKSFIIPRNEDNTLGEPTTFVNDAHEVGLKVHPYTFRAENNFLPKEYQSSGSRDSFGDFTGEIRKYLATGIDGLFSDQPDVPLRVRGACTHPDTI